MEKGGEKGGKKGGRESVGEKTDLDSHGLYAHALNLFSDSLSSVLGAGIVDNHVGAPARTSMRVSTNKRCPHSSSMQCT